MANISSFYPVSTGGGGAASPRSGSYLRMFYTGDSWTIPNTVCYMAYGVIGAGGIGPGGGFSFSEGPVTCASSFSVCAAPGSATCSDFNGCGSPSCITGICIGTICATGGGAACCCCTTCFSGVGGCIGFGSGGQINTCGGNAGWYCAQVYGRGGAGGLYGNGGDGGQRINETCLQGYGGGGYGSGGGGGAGNSGCSESGTLLVNGKGGAGAGAGINSRWVAGGSTYQPVATQGGNGHAGRGSLGHPNWLSYQPKPAEIGYIPGYTDKGHYSQAKTFLGAAGGGASAWPGSCNGGSGCIVDKSGQAAPGGGGSYFGRAGFGGGAGSFGSAPGIGGGGIITNNGFAIIEYWTS